MYVVDVIPFSRSAPPGTLTYRSRDELAPGTLVDIMLRKSAIQGLVVACTPVAEAKAVLKNAHFTPSSSAPSRAGVLPAALLSAAERVAEYHAVTLGSTLAALFGELAKSGATLSFGADVVSGAGDSFEPIEAPIGARAKLYKEQISFCIAERKTALLVAPTLAELEYWKKELASFKPLTLSGSLTGARRIKALESAREHIGLVISTPAFSWTPIDALGLVILDRISAGGYVLPKRPHLDMARALRLLAEERRLPFIVGDYPLPLEYRPIPEAALSVPLSIPISIHDARKPKDDQQAEHEPFQAIPKKIEEKIKEIMDAGGRTLVLASRRGYAPAVVCRDCGQTVEDERGMQLSFTTAGGKRMLRSADGKTVIDAKIHCARCDSWNLLPLGVGVERVIEELTKTFPNARIIAPDIEKLRTVAGAKKALDGMHEPGAIVIGTEGLLPWLLLEGAERNPFDLAVIASSDSLLALPFWKSRERFVRLAHFLASFAQKFCVVTRHPDDTAVMALSEPSGTAFFEEETMLRRALSYPPFGTMVIVHAEGNQRLLDEMQSAVQAAFGTLTPSLLPDRALSKSVFRRTFVATLPENTWPDEVLSRSLQSLPPSVDVRIDPETLW